MPPIVDVGDWRCTVRDLEIIIVLLVFNFIPQRSRHSLTLPMSLFKDSATVTQTPGDGITNNKLESSAYQISLFSRMEKRSEVYRRNNNGHKTLPAALLTLH